MRDIRDEAVLDARQVLELPDLALESLGHRVERCGEAREIVFPFGLHAFGQTTRSEALAAPTLLKQIALPGATTSRVTT